MQDNDSGCFLDGFLIAFVLPALIGSASYLFLTLYTSMIGETPELPVTGIWVATPIFLLAIALFFHRFSDKPTASGYFTTVFVILALYFCFAGALHVITILGPIMRAGSLDVPDNQEYETFIAGTLVIISVAYLYYVIQTARAKNEDEIDNEYRTPGWNYPPDWEEIRQEVLERDGYECGNCGNTENLHVHHIVPLSLGGTNALSNLRTLCKNCHTRLHPHMRS